MTRWSLTVSDDVDQRLRAFLGKKAAKKGGMSQFIEKAVMQTLCFEETVDAIQERNLAFSEDEIENVISEAVRETRKVAHNASPSP